MPIYTFIGGHADGRRIAVDGVARSVEIPIPPARPTTLEEGDKQQSRSIETVRYSRIELEDAHGGRHVCFSTFSSAIVLRALLDNYRPHKGENAGGIF